MLEVRGINAFYGDSQILWGIDLSVSAGGRVAVLGRNGAGKTTLFKSIMNAGPTVHGSVMWRGDDIAAHAHFQRARAGLSLVPEDRRIFSHLTVRENLLMALPGGVDRAGRCEAILQAFPILQPLVRRMGSQLSGGQKQMLAIARGLMAEPALLMLDEPTEGVAPVVVEEMVHAINAICEASGTALLLSEQSLWFSRQCTSFVYILDAGRISYAGDWAGLDRAPEILDRYLAV
jgi:branched-chain amino acid transport system ATP-binding protein